MRTAESTVGVIADDVTGGTDAGAAFGRPGLRTLLYFDSPGGDTPVPDHDVIVIALKTRTRARAAAVAQSLEAAAWLRGRGAGQIFFKYCSTFDSTPEGNIGPVLDALAGELGAALVVQTPSSPEHGRTQYAGHLFVDGVPLAESPMRHHPLTPMTDSSLPRLLGAQTGRPVGTIAHRVVTAGAAAIRAALDEEGAPRYLFADALTDADLAEIGRAVLDQPLVAGAAGLAGGLASALAERLPRDARAARPADPTGRAAVLAGSCSRRTLEQIGTMRAAGRPAYHLDALVRPDAASLAHAALGWYDVLSDPSAPVIYSSLPPDQLREVQRRLGVAGAAELLEGTHALIARGLVDRGVTRLITAGGETSGAIVRALDVPGGVIGREAARGVPWIHVSGRPLALLLKSGNFGGPDLLLRASR